MKTNITFPNINASDVHIGIVRSRWHGDMTQSLTDAAVRGMLEYGVDKEHIYIHDVPGSFELLYGAKYMAETRDVDVVLVLGVLIKGETQHFEYISSAVTTGVAKMNIDLDIPVVFGVLTCLNENQVRERATGENNHGYMWGKTAVEMGMMKIGE